MGRQRLRLGVLVGAVAMLEGPAAFAAGKALGDVEAEIRELRQQNERNQQRIKELEDTVRQLKAQQTEQAEKQKKAEEAKAEEPRPDVVRRVLDKYWGQHRFLVTGYGFAQWSWNDRDKANTFEAGLNPILLFRLSDRLLFSGELEVKLPSDAETEVNLEFAEADYLLNDYVTVTAGKFLLPFGEFIERLHPPWINKLVTHPLIFREGDEGGILPFSTLGLQLRGGAPLGYADGTNVEYAAYISNGPHYELTSEGGAAGPALRRAALGRSLAARAADTAGPSPMIGDPLAFNNVDNNRNKAFGARVGVRPLPLAWNAGRWRIGASTFDGEWDDKGSLWFTSWGIDSVYQYQDAELRGEYVSTKRELPGPQNDRRDGWYIQGAYQLTSLVPAPWNRLEVIGRYSVQDQRAVLPDSDLVPHPRQASLGIDYWLTPSVVWKLEYDRDLPHGAPDNNEVWSQFAVGF